MYKSIDYVKDNSKGLGRELPLAYLVLLHVEEPVAALPNIKYTYAAHRRELILY